MEKYLTLNEIKTTATKDLLIWHKKVNTWIHAEGFNTQEEWEHEEKFIKEITIIENELITKKIPAEFTNIPYVCIDEAYSVLIENAIPARFSYYI